MSVRFAISHAASITLFAPTILIVAPAINERPNISPLVEAIGKTMGNIVWELIVVDDDSPDGTAEHSRSPVKATQSAVSGGCGGRTRIEC